MGAGQPVGKRANEVVVVEEGKVPKSDTSARPVGNPIRMDRSLSGSIRIPPTVAILLLHERTVIKYISHPSSQGMSAGSGR